MKQWNSNKAKNMKTSRPRSPSHAAKFKTPEDRIWEFGSVLGVRDGRLICRPCSLSLDHTRRSTIVEHLRSRKHQRFLAEVDLVDSPPAPATATSSSLITPSLIYVDALEEANSQENSVRPSTPTNTNQGLTGPYLLKKETHCSTVLDQLLRDDTYTDVTLTAEGLSLRAHRIVLCLSSPYFRQVLSREQSVQSVVLLRDVKFAELRNILNFIYTGEATVDAAELESFMRTAEMLEITSLCEGHKFLSSRGLSQGSTASSFTIGDFERLVGTKSSRKDASPSPSKTRRISGEGPPSRCSSTEPTASTNPLTLMNEEPSFIPPSTSHTIKEEIDTTADETPIIAESTDGEGTKPKSEKPRKRRKRMHSSESIGSFAAIAGVQKVSEADDDDEVFPSSAKSSHNQQPEESNKPTLNSDVDNTATPGRCPYCPHVSQTYEGVSMMRHLLVSHPCKPAFPCSFCWRVFVKRTNFKTHLQSCQDSY